MERDDILQEELKRFNQIGSYVNSLSEQMLGGIGSGSGFVKNQPSRFGEQDDPELEDDAPIEVADEELEGDDDLGLGDDDLGLGDDDLGLEDDDLGLEDDDLGDEVGSDATEVDVTDIVTIAKGAEEKAGEAKDTLDQQTDKIGDLMTKLGDLESKLTVIDTITKSIDELGEKIEQSAPPTQEERLEMISLESGPYTQKPLDYWEQKTGESGKKKGKAEYVLTQDEVDDYDTTDIKNSFDAPTEEQEEYAEEEIKVLGNQPNK
jgi:hypothetical protein|tara:strand:- start:3035 stop:3823 length:789 start_codon:yes stop_codon:yes gene_type:complete